MACLSRKVHNIIYGKPGAGGNKMKYKKFSILRGGMRESRLQNVLKMKNSKMEKKLVTKQPIVSVLIFRKNLIAPGLYVAVTLV